MGGDRERNVYRAIVLVALVAGALGFLWYLSQGGEGLGEGGIFRFFSDPAGDPGPTPAE
ncbi:hypothetical protein [Leucobacter sp.]